MVLHEGRKPPGLTHGLLRGQAAFAYCRVTRGEEGHDFFNGDSFSRSDRDRQVLGDIAGRCPGRALRRDTCLPLEELSPSGLRDGELGLIGTDYQRHPFLIDRLAEEGFQMVAA